MNHRILILTLSAVFCCAAAMSQEVRFIRIETTEPFTPVYQSEDGLETVQAKGLNTSSTGSKKWFRVAAEYATDAGWIDRLTLEYYILFPGETNAFKGTVHYADVPAGRGHLSEMYLHFNSYARHCKRGVIQYAVVALIDGRPAAVETNRRLPEGWWKTISTHPYGLLDRSDTPFAVFNAEKFDAPCR